MRTLRGRSEARYIFTVIVTLFVLLTGFDARPAAAREAAAEGGVVCTVYPVWLIAKELASGTGLPVSMLLPADLGCPHHYSLTPADVSGLERSSLILANGLGFEPFLSRLSDSGFAGRIRQIAPAARARASHQDEQPNPHLFTTPAGLAGMIDEAADALSQVVPSGTADLLRRNADGLRARLAETDKAWAALAPKLRGVPVVVTHDSLDYISSAMNLSVVARLETDDEHQHSAHSRLEIERAIRDRRPAALLTEDVELPDEILELGREHGIPVIPLPTMTAAGSAPSSDPLVSSMQAVVAALAPLASAPAPVPASPEGR